MNRIIILLLFIFTWEVSTSQKTDVLKSDTLVVVKPYKPTLVKANKLSDQPVIADTQKIELDFSYSFLERQLKSKYKLDSIQPAKIKGEPLVKLYRGYAIIGFGNNTTPYGELFYNSLRSRKNNLGIHLKHFSSNGINDIDESGFRHNNFDIYGKKFTKKLMFKGGLSYDIHKLGYYGEYDNLSITDQNLSLNTEQQYSTIGGNIMVQNLTTDSTDINFDVGLAYYNLSDNYAASENNIKLKSSLQTRLDNGLLGTFDVEIDNNSYESKLLDSNTAASTTILKIYPKLNAGNDRWQLTGGPAFFLEAGDESRFVLRAIGEFRLNLIEEILIPYAGVKGGLIRNSYKTFISDNPFVNTNLTLLNSDNVLEIYGGLRGSFSNRISFNTSIGNGQINDQPFYVKTFYVDERFSRSFNLVYDDLSITTIRGELSYSNADKLNVLLSGEFYQYEVDEIAEAWHMPGYRVTLSGIYDLRDKILLKLDLFAIGSQKAEVLENIQSTGGVNAIVTSSETLDGVFDANLGLEYRYTKKVAAFLNFNNIGSFRYLRWQDYPTQRFNVMGGLKFSF